MKAQHAIVTGSSSGLGLEITEFLLEKDWVVFGASRSGTKILHNNFFDIVCDVRHESEVERFFEEVEAITGEIDLLVNNAGICDFSPIEETSSKEFLNHFETNTLGVFHMLKHLRNFVIEDTTHIINIATVASKKAFPSASAYCASKFALIGLIETVKKEWQDLNLKFSTLYPGAIDTPLWDSMDEGFPRERMLSSDDFMYIFDFVLSSPRNIQFPEIDFLHRNGAIE